MSFLCLAVRLRTLSLAATISLAASPWLFAHAAGANGDILGSWKLIEVLDSSDVAALDDRQAARLVGRVLIIEKTKVTLAGETCEDPEFERHYEDTVRYLREEAHAASGRLGLPSTVAVIDLGCTEALVKSHERIVLYWKGYFFDAVRLPSSDSMRARQGIQPSIDR